MQVSELEAHLTQKELRSARFPPSSLPSTHHFCLSRPNVNGFDNSSVYGTFHRTILSFAFYLWGDLISHGGSGGFCMAKTAWWADSPTCSKGGISTVANVVSTSRGVQEVTKKTNKTKGVVAPVLTDLHEQSSCFNLKFLKQTTPKMCALMLFAICMPHLLVQKF